MLISLGMKARHAKSGFVVVATVALRSCGVAAQSVVYVTDLKIFTSLAPCAASAISLHVMSQTSSNCPQAVTDLQECVCTRTNFLASISSAMSVSVSDNCGSTASDDQASAATVLSAYCNQKTPSAMPTFRPPSFAVSQYITDMAAMEHLAPCASSALSYAVLSMTNTYCPPEPTGLAVCACARNQNSLRISQVINSSVKYSCASHSADITSAQAVFSAYCNLVASGKSEFPVPSPPPGDMSYYITALPQYKSLASCARFAVSFAINSQTNMYCPQGVQALASCVCIKESMSGSLSSSITSEVKWSCSTTASQDLTSALAVFDAYCSAARGQVKATGVSESVAQSYTPAQTGSVSQQPGAGQSGTSVDGATSESSAPNKGIIAGAVVGAVALLAIIAGLVVFLMRRARRNNAVSHEIERRSQSPEHHYKPELDATTQVRNKIFMPQPGPPRDEAKAGQAAAEEVVSPLSAIPTTSELHGLSSPISPESPSSQGHFGFQPQGEQPKTWGAPGMHWQSGPVAEYSELDGTQHARNTVGGDSMR